MSRASREQSSEDVRTRNLRVPRRCGSARRSSADGEALPHRRRAVADALQAPVRRHRAYRARRAIARKRSAGTKYRTKNSLKILHFLVLSVGMLATPAYNVLSDDPNPGV